MKAKKLFPDLSFKRLWDKIKELENKVGDGSDSEQNKKIVIPFIDVNNVLYKQSSNSFTYTATEDCVLCGLISTTSQGVSHFYIDNKEILAPYIAISGAFSLPIFMPIKKGQTVKVGTNSMSTATPLTFYKILI